MSEIKKIRLNDVDYDIHAKYADVAETLDGRIETTEAEFTFRPTSDDISITDGSAKIKTIKGNTVFFNQLLQNGNFENGTTGWTVSNTIISIENNKLKIVNNADNNNGIFRNISLPKGHKVLITTAFKRNVSTSISYSILLRKKGMTTYDTYTKPIASSSRQVVTGIITTTAEIDRFYFLPTYGRQGNETLVDYVALYDLTMMFGEGNEPTEEEFFKLFPNHYYPYNTGELMSLNTQSIKTVGFNQLNLMRTEMVTTIPASTPTTPKDFNENQIWLNFAHSGYSNTPNGVYDIKELTANKIVAVSSSNATSGYGLGFPIMVFPNTSYYVNAEGTNETIYIGFFDYRGVNISYLLDHQNKTFTTPSDCVWCVVILKATADNIEMTVENPVLNLSHTGYRNGEYELYKQEDRQLPINTYFPNGMNANDYAFDELTQTHAIQRVKVVNVEDLNWYMNEPGNFGCDEGLPYYEEVGNYIRCDWDYVNGIDSYEPSTSEYDDCAYLMSDDGTMTVRDSSCSTLEAFITKNTGKKMIIDLDTPIETSVEEPLNFEYYVEDFGTEEALSLLQSSSPFKASIYYDFNAIDTIRTNRRNIAMLIDEVDELQESQFALSSNTKFYIKGRGTTAGEWIGFDERITEYYDGLNVYFYINVAGSTTTTLNINGLGAKTIYRGGTTKLTTQYPVDSVVNLIYSSTLNDGCWLTAPYDYDTNTNYTLLDNSQPMAGGVGIFPYSLCALNVDGKMESFTTSGGTGTDKEANTTARFPLGTKIHYYNSSTTTSSGTRMPYNTNYYIYNAVNINYTSNFSGTTGATSFGQYQNAFLKVNVNNDNTWSPAAYSETNSVIVRFDELETDCYYIYIGHTYYSSYYQVALNINNPLYYYDGKLLEKADIAVINTGATLEPGIPTNVAKIGGRNITVTMPNTLSQNYSCRIRQYYVNYTYLTPTSVNTDYEVITFKAGGEDFNKALVSGTFHIKFETVGSELAQKAGVAIKIKDADGKIIRKFDQTIPPLQGMHLISFNAFLNTLAGTESEYSVTFSINALAGYITLTGYDQEKYDNNFSEIIITESKG